MTAHQLARHLLTCEDLPVIMPGPGSDAYQDWEVVTTYLSDSTFVGASDDKNTPKNNLGYPLLRPCIEFGHRLS